MACGRSSGRATTLVSSDPPFVFVHVPKTGGSSVKAALAGYATHDWIPAYRNAKHLTIAEIDALCPHQEMVAAGRFAVVRDPRDRLASLYDYVRSNPFHPLYVAVVERDFASFVRGCANAPRSSMSAYLVVDGALAVDEVIRYEQLAASWPLLVGRLGIDEAIPLPSVNVSIRDDATKWSAALLDFVAETWHHDFELFGYDSSSTPQRLGSV